MGRTGVRVTCGYAWRASCARCRSRVPRAAALPAAPVWRPRGQAGASRAHLARDQSGTLAVVVAAPCGQTTPDLRVGSAVAVVRENLPVIPDAHIDAIIADAKLVPDDDWRSRLTPTIRSGANLIGSYDLRDGIDFGPVRGSLRLCTRSKLADALDFSVVLAFTDLQGNDYRLVRCNGHHPNQHVNRLEGSVIPPVTPHIHRATERYLAAKRTKHDGFATETDAYRDVASAIEHMGSLVGLVAEGRLLL